MLKKVQGKQEIKWNAGTFWCRCRISGVDVQPVLIHRQQSPFFHTAEDIINPHHGRLVLLYVAQLAQLGDVARHHKRALWEVQAWVMFHKCGAL